MAQKPSRFERRSVLPGSLQQATVGDATYPGIFSCDLDTELRSVAQMMSLHRIHCVAVLSSARDGPG